MYNTELPQLVLQVIVTRPHWSAVLTVPPEYV